MSTAFPELSTQPGWYVDRSGYHEHWWCTLPSGEIIDPTVQQFSNPGFYEEYLGPLPTGKCPNCGQYIFSGGSVCDDQCAREYEAYLDAP